MKKLLLMLAASLLCSLAHSQEAEPAGSTAELAVIPHLELVPNVADQNTGFNLGNSSLYTLFEGSASEHFSWTVANHWFSASYASFIEDLTWPYTCLGRSDVTNWVDYFKADLTFGSWNFTLGKDCMSIGGFEYEDWDWDVHAGFATPLWCGIAPYQWGAKAAWTTPSEMSTFALQMTTSPYGEHPFSSGLWAFSGSWRGEYGWFSNIWSATAVATEKGVYDWIISLGQKIEFGDWSFTLDYNNVVGFSDDDAYSMLKGTNLNGTLAFAPSDKFDCAAKYIWTNIGWIAGAYAQFYPIPGTDDLRLHAGVSYDKLFNTVALNAGLRYYLRFHLW